MSNGSLGNDLLKVSLFSNKVPSGSSSVIFTAIHFSISVLCMFESWSRRCFHRSNASLMLSISRRWVEHDSMLLIVKRLRSRRTLSLCDTNLIVRKQSNLLIKFCLSGDFVSFISRMRYKPLHHSIMKSLILRTHNACVIAQNDVITGADFSFRWQKQRKTCGRLRKFIFYTGPFS